MAGKGPKRGFSGFAYLDGRRRSQRIIWSKVSPDLAKGASMVIGTMKTLFAHSYCLTLLYLMTEMAGKGPQRGFSGFASLDGRRRPLRNIWSGLKCRLSWQGAFDRPWHHVNTFRPLGLSHLVVFKELNVRKGSAEGVFRFCVPGRPKAPPLKYFVGS